MKKSVLLFLLIAVLPLAALAGKVDAVMNVADYDYGGGAEAAGGGGAEPAGGAAADDMGDDHYKAELDDRKFFNIPSNMTEEEWRADQLKNFKKFQMNEWQKAEFERWERHRFFQWQQMKFQQLQQLRQRKMQEEHQKFLVNADTNMKQEQAKHQSWLNSLLNDPESRRELVREAREREDRGL